MGLSAGDIAALITEIAPAVMNGRIQKVSQPAPRAVTFDIRTPGRTVSLFLSADPETARVHFLLSRPLPNPPTPPPFCRFLRAHIQGARIDTIEQVAGDRIVRLGMTAREGPYAFIAELTGRRANLLLVGGENRVMIALDSGRERVGTAYQPPTFKAPAEPMRSALIVPHETAQAFPLSHAVEQRYRIREDELDRTRRRQAQLAALNTRIKKAVRRVQVLQEDLDKAARYKNYARYGELLKANLHAMRKGHDRLTVVDYFDPTLPELVIPLDPSKSPQGNLDDYFKKYRKHVAAEREIRPRLARAEEELKTLQTERHNRECGISEPGQAAIQRDATTSVHRDLKGKSAARSGPFRRFTSGDGVPIYVGRNARENEALTFGEARADDVWLHAHGTPGSHVVIRLEKGADLPHETLRDAATLALFYSDLKKSGKGEVIYTRRKHVRKIKGKPPGTVAVMQEKSLFVQLDRARLDRLKERMG